MEYSKMVELVLELGVGKALLSENLVVGLVAGVLVGVVEGAFDCVAEGAAERSAEGLSEGALDEAECPGTMYGFSDGVCDGLWLRRL
jgi:hypothetical protein